MKKDIKSRKRKNTNSSKRVFVKVSVVLILIIMLFVFISSKVSASNINYESLCNENGTKLSSKANVISSTTYFDSTVDYSARIKKVNGTKVKIYNYGTTTEKTYSGKLMSQVDGTQDEHMGNNSLKDVNSTYNYFYRTDDSKAYLYYSFVLGAGDEHIAGGENAGANLTNVATIVYEGGLKYKGKIYNVKLDIDEIYIPEGFDAGLQDKPCFNILIGEKSISSSEYEKGVNSVTKANVGVGNYDKGRPSVGIWMKRDKATSGGKAYANIKYSIIDPDTNAEHAISGIYKITDLDRKQGVLVDDGNTTTSSSNTFFKDISASAAETVKYKDINGTYGGKQIKGAYIYSTTGDNLTGSDEVEVYRLVQNKSSMNMVFKWQDRTAYSGIAFKPDGMVQQKYQLKLTVHNGKATTPSGTSANPSVGTITGITSGSNKTINFEPTDGYEFESITVNGTTYTEATGSSSEGYTFSYNSKKLVATDIQENWEVVVRYKKKASGSLVIHYMQYNKTTGAVGSEMATYTRSNLTVGKSYNFVDNTTNVENFVKNGGAISKVSINTGYEFDPVVTKNKNQYVAKIQDGVTSNVYVYYTQQSLGLRVHLIGWTPEEEDWEELEVIEDTGSYTVGNTWATISIGSSGPAASSALTNLLSSKNITIPSGWTLNGGRTLSISSSNSDYPYSGKFVAGKMLDVYAFYDHDKINYNVEHWKMNTSGSGYTKAETQTIQADYWEHITLTPKSYSGYEYNASKNLRNGSPIGEDNDWQYVINTTNITFILFYDLQNHTVTAKVTPSIAGEIDPTSQLVRHGNNAQTISYAPYDGWVLSSIKVDGTTLTGTNLTNNANSYSFTNVTADHSIEVIYQRAAEYEIQLYFQNTEGTDLGTYPSEDDSIIMFSGTKTPGTYSASSVTNGAFATAMSSVTTHSGYYFDSEISEIGNQTLQSGQKTVYKVYAYKPFYEVQYFIQKSIGSNEYKKVSSLWTGVKAADAGATVAGDQNAIYSLYSTDAITLNEDSTVGGVLSEDNKIDKARNVDNHLVLILFYDLNAHDISYTVEYYKNNVKQTGDTQTKTENVVVSVNTLTVAKSEINTTNKYTGYHFVKTDPTTIPDTINDGGVIKVYYEEDKHDISYTVEYYKDNVKQTGDTQTKTQNVGVSVNTLTVAKSEINTTNKYTGYHFVKTDPATIPDTVSNGTVIKVYYEEDKHDISYTVEYYKNNVKQTGDTQTKTQNVGVSVNTLTVAKSEINTTNKYTGYHFVKTDPATIPDTITNGGVIKVYYEEDKHDISYTVEYYKDNVKQTGDTQTKTQNVGVSVNTLTVVKSEINTTNKYDGYHFVKTNPTTIPDTIANGGVIKVYYEKNEEDKHDISYTVEYYKNNVKQTGDTETKTQNVAVSVNTLTVVKSEINTTNKYTGYHFVKTDPATIPDTVSNGTVIKVYYEEDKHDISYTVEYYKNNVKQTGDTQTKTQNVAASVNTLTVAKSEINTTNKYTGYHFVKTDPATIPDTVSNGTVIKVYYEEDKHDISYTVEYYKNNVKQTGDTQTKTQNVAASVNTLTVAKSEINTTNKYTGYHFVKTDPATIPDTIANGGVIKVYYEEDKHDITYTVEYYKNNVKQDGDTQTKTQNVGVSVNTITVVKSEINTTNKYTGYHFVKTNPATIPDSIENGGVIKVYYEEDKHDITYTVEYYKNNVKQTADTQTKIQNVGVSVNTLTVVKSEINTTNKYTGYHFVKTDPATIPDTITNGGVIKVYYEEDKHDISYTVEYYKDNVKQDGDTQTQTQNVGVSVNTLTVAKSEINTTNKYAGYHFVKTNPVTIPDTVTNGTVIKVYYEEDKHDISYTVEYYKNNVKQTGDTQTKTQNVAASVNTLTVAKSEINTTNKYTGYHFVKTDPATIPDTITNGGVIKVYYEEDKHDISYTVEYYKDNVKQDGDTETKTENVVVSVNTLTVAKSEINTTNKYTGYHFVKTDPTTIPDTITNGGVIKVYYEEDKHDISYTVEYYKDNVKQDGDTQTKTQNVAASVNTLTVVKSEINTTNKYDGYHFVKTNPATIPNTVNNGTVIKVYYEKDEEGKHNISYIVEYYKDDVKQDDDTETKTESVEVSVNTLTVAKSEINTTNKYTGYHFVKTDPTTIPDTVNNGTVIKVYYEEDKHDLSYTVEYYKNNVKQDEDTETKTQSVGVSVNTITVVKSEINTTNKYEGYHFVKTDPTTIPNAVNNGTVIKVYYEENKHDISYTVEYYKDNVIQNNDTLTKTENVAISVNTLAVDKTEINTKNKYDGYHFVKTEPEEIPDTVNNGDVIKVYYETNKHNISYTVEYYKDNVKQDGDTQTVTQNVDETVNKLAVNKTQINLINKYTGYHFVKTDPTTIPDTIENSGVIKVYYEKDEEEKHDISYTVEYYRDNVKQDDDTQTKTQNVTVSVNTLTVEKSEINTTNKYTGYHFVKTDPATLPDIIENSGVIKVYYEKDEEEKYDISYTVEYYIDNVKQDNDTQTKTQNVTVSVNTLTVEKSEINTTNKYTGYHFVKTDPATLPDIIENSGVIKVYYEKDEEGKHNISYTVEYYKDNVKQDDDTQTKTENVAISVNTLTVVKSEINTIDRYTGFRFVKTDPTTIPDTVNNGTVIKVYYEKVKHTVTFDPDNGTPISSESVPDGEKVTEPTDPTKPGYTFEGWYDKDTNDKFDFDTPIKKDYDLIAKWTPIEYKIIYVLYGGTNDPENPSKYKTGDNIIFKSPTKEGYKFLGWFEDSEYTTPITQIVNRTGDITVHAKWEKIEPNTYPYTVTYYLEQDNGEYAEKDKITDYAEENKEIQAEIKEFTGYEENTEHEDRKVEGIVTKDGLELKVFYKLIKHKVTFEPKNDTTIPTQIVKHEQKAEEPNKPVKEGYEFKYWYYLDDDGNEIVYNFDTKVTRDYDLIAKWVEVIVPEENDEPTVIKTDETQAPKVIPNAGANKTVFFIIIGISVIVAITIGKKYLKLKKYIK